MPDQPRVEFRTAPERYRHWRLAIDGPVATLTMDVDEQGGIVPGYELKLNSYDLGVDIELYDAVQRLRFEHPEVGAVVITSGKPKIFCAGANIRMLAAAPHGWKVNFCKFTNETRNGIEDATANSGQTYLAAVNGTASGGGYELALACEHIMLVDDRSSAVSLPELPLLGVLPGTGGLTRVSDKRHVRRDLADYFSTKAEGVGGKKAVQWRLVDEAVPRPRWDETVAERAAELAARSGRPQDAQGVALTELRKTRGDDAITYDYVEARLDRDTGKVDISVKGPQSDPPASIDADPGERGVLAAGGDPRARRPDPGPAHQRDRAGHLGVPHAGRSGPGPGLRRTAPGQRQRGRLVRQRGPALPQADAAAAGRDQPQPDRGDRAGQLLRRVAARARAGRRPVVPAGRGVRGRPRTRIAARAPAPPLPSARPISGR